MERTVRALYAIRGRIRCAVMSEQTDHYFTAEPASAAERRTLDVTLAGHRVTVQTAPGVFCPDRLDVGTAVLLEHVPAPPATGAVLDLGCGWGPIALTLGLLSPQASVWAVDVNERALDLARHNAAAAGLADVHACTPEEVPADLTFAAIWSNPPIRVGKAVLHDMLLHLAAAPGRRRRGVPGGAEEPGLGLAAAVAGRGTGREVPRPVLGRPSCERAHLQGAVSDASGARPSLSRRRVVPARRPPGRGAGCSCGSR